MGNGDDASFVLFVPGSLIFQDQQLPRREIPNQEESEYPEGNDRGASDFFVHSSCAEDGLGDEEEFVGRLDLNERGVGNLGKMEAQCIEWEDRRGFYIQETIVMTSVIVYES